MVQREERRENEFVDDQQVSRESAFSSREILDQYIIAGQKYGFPAGKQIFPGFFCFRKQN